MSNAMITNGMLFIFFSVMARFSYRIFKQMCAEPTLYGVISKILKLTLGWCLCFLTFWFECFDICLGD